jgi:hypothetical protein
MSIAVLGFALLVSAGIILAGYVRPAPIRIPVRRKSNR